MTILPFRWLVIPFVLAGGVLFVLDLLWAHKAPALGKGLVGTLWSQEHWLGGPFYGQQREQLGRWCFTLAVTLFEARMLIGSSTILNTGTLQAVLYDLTMLLLLAKIVLFTRYSYRQALTALVLIAPYLMAQVYIPNHMMMIAYLTMLAAKDADFRHALKGCMVVTVPLVLAIYGLSEAGIIGRGDVYVESWRSRDSIGFVHPNTAGLFLLFIFVGWLLLRFRKLRWWDVAGLVGLLLIAHFMVGTRGPMLAMLTCLILLALLKWVPRFFQWKPIRWLFAASPALACTGLFVVAALYDETSSLWVKLNGFSSDRLRLCHGVMESFPLELIIRDNYFTEDLYTAENIFFDNLYQYGILCLAVLLLCMTVLVCRCLQRNALPELIVITGMLVFGMFEIFPKSPYSNVMMWMWAPVLYGLPAQRLTLFVPQEGEDTPRHKQ